MKRILAIAFVMLLLPAAAQKKKTVYNRFAGVITVIDQDVIKYDDELLLIYNTDKNLMKVFESGLLYPGLFKYPGIVYQKKDALNAVVHNFTVENCRWINSKSGKIRLFKLVLSQKNSNQSTEYYVELYNPNGTSKGDFSNFVQHAKLKSIKRARSMQ